MKKMCMLSIAMVFSLPLCAMEESAQPLEAALISSYENDPQVPEALNNELERLRKKIEAGAHLIMTQPLYQLSDLTDFLDQYGDCPVPILAGIMPLNSFKHAEYLHNEVPGISIPRHIREAMQKAGDQGAQVGLELAEELLAELRRFCQGAYLVPSFGRYDDMCELVKRLKAGAAQPKAIVQK